MEGATLLKYVATGRDVGKAVAYLVDDGAAGYATGAEIVLDGGTMIQPIVPDRDLS